MRSLAGPGYDYEMTFSWKQFEFERCACVRWGSLVTPYGKYGNTQIAQGQHAAVRLRFRVWDGNHVDRQPETGDAD